MGVKLIEAAKAAYTYPLLIKQLLHTPMTRSPDQEIAIGIKRMIGS
jgi:fatty-acyl-CoA synthase